MKTSCRIRVCVLSCMVAIVCQVSWAQQICPRLNSESQILERLQQGGLVILLRHAKDVTVDPVREHCDDPDRVLGGRASAGNRQARQIRRVLVNLPIGEVYYSPACRTVDTARLIFGELDPANQKPSLKIGADPSWLLSRLATVPPEGNEVLVSHSEVLSAIRLNGRRLINGQSSYGLAAIFDPTAANTDAWLLGCLEPDQWRRLD